jgi:hypothetical protein
LPPRIYAWFRVEILTDLLGLGTRFKLLEMLLVVRLCLPQGQLFDTPVSVTHLRWTSGARQEG